MDENKDFAEHKLETQARHLKQILRINNILTLFLALVVLFGLWIDYQRWELNQRYKRILNQQERQVESFNQILDYAKTQIDVHLN